MKKFILIFIILISGIYAASAGDIVIEPKAGININLTLDNEFMNVEGIEFYGVEYYYKPTNRIDVGFGVLYQKVSTTKNDTPTEPTQTVERLPLYLAMKLHLGNDWVINPYIKLTAGYLIILDSDFEGLENGETYALGLGLEVANFTFEGSVNVEENHGNEDFRGALGFAMVIGYRFAY